MFHVWQIGGTLEKSTERRMRMYRALESFATKDRTVKRQELLEDDFTTQEEIQDLLTVGYIEVDTGAIKITENGQYNVEIYDLAKVNVQGSSEEVDQLVDEINGEVV